MDIWVMVDVVHNHVGHFDNDDPSEFVPFNKMEYYHPYCAYENSFDKFQRENC